jgi:predicted RNA-binding protein with PUA-like domain
MAFFLLKTEPSTYSFADLQRHRTTTWDGVENPLALKHIKSMEPGDQLVIYHTGDEKAAVGTATVISSPFPDPNNPKLLVFNVSIDRPLKTAIPLATFKADKRFKTSELVKISRLSVIPLTDVQWKAVLAMGGLPESQVRPKKKAVVEETKDEE